MSRHHTPRSAVVRPRRRLIVGSAAAVGVFVLACGENSLTAPGERHPLAPSGPARSIGSSTTQIGAPPFSDGEGLVVETGMVVPKHARYTLKISGLITASPNAANPCSVTDPVRTYGPGARGDELGVSVDGLATPPFSDSWETGELQSGDYEHKLVAGRQGLFAMVGCNAPNGDRVGGPVFAISGSQTLTLDVLEVLPFQLFLDPADTSVTAGSDVDFKTRLPVPDGTFRFEEWSWAPESGESRTADWCTGYGSCLLTVDASGTMTVKGTLGGFVDGHREPYSASAHVKVVTVQDPPPKPEDDVSIKIVRAEGPNPGKSFTFARAERRILLEASVSPSNLAPDVRWEVLDAPGDQVAAIPPATAPTGALTSFDLPRHPTSRWPAHLQGNPQLDRKTLRYQVTATVTKDGKTYRSDPVIVSQDLVDTIREEYYEFDLQALGRHMPQRREFSPVAMQSVGWNPGDYPQAIIEPRFKAKLDELQTKWPYEFQINVIYRNPVHNLTHVSASSRPSRASWHMWGCAADLQTYPKGASTPKTIQARRTFWNKLARLAQNEGWDVEPFNASGIGHVHVELDCP